jgi:8-oxo-dGTP pyrophosphatase MutT (NUDIX family)
LRFLCEFEDELYPFEGVTNERNAARAIVLDSYGRIALLHLYGEVYGRCIDSFVTPGGGMESGETPDMAVKREILEELGFDCDILYEVGIIVDYYNDIKRKNISHYYIVKTSEEKETKRTPTEDAVIKEVKWLNIDEAIHLLDNYQADPRGRTLHRRDLCALREARLNVDLFK